MKILWVKPGKLLPLDSGGKLRTYNILRYLSVHHEVAYLSYYDGDRDQQYEQEILLHFPNAIPIATRRPELSGISRYWDYLQNLPLRVPYAVNTFFAQCVHEKLHELLSPGRYDVAVCDFLASSPNFPKDLPVPTVLFQHNVETMLWKRRAQFSDRWIDRCVAKIESRKMERYEAAQLRRFHHVIAVSNDDRRCMGRMVAGSCISTVPTGVDLSQYHHDASLQPKVPLVVFTGSMDWQPNIDGVEYFCREIWPRVLIKVPAARFRIVGRRPGTRVTSLRSGSVEVTGTVSSVVDHLREAMVFVVPLRIGGGTRIKIYEAMAMGKATVSTTIGAEGLDVTHRHDILLADDPSTFANHVVDLLFKETLRRRYEDAAAATARKYDWSVVVQRFEDILHAVVRDGKSASDSLRLITAAS